MKLCMLYASSFAHQPCRRDWHHTFRVRLENQNEIYETIRFCPRSACRVCAVAAGIGTGHDAIHHHHDAGSACSNNGEHHDHDDADSASGSNGEHHHDYVDRTNSAANPNHSDDREHHEVQAPSQEGEEGEGNNDYNNDPGTGAYVDDDHYHDSAAVIQQSRGSVSNRPRRHESGGAHSPLSLSLS